MQLRYYSIVWLSIIFFAPSLAFGLALGESMQLESRLARQRALHWLWEQVQMAESDQASLQALAHLGVALANEGHSVYDSELKALKAHLSKQAEQVGCLADLLQLLRFELRNGGEKMTVLLQIYTEKAFAQGLQQESLTDQQFCLEIHYLLMPEQVLLNEHELIELQKRLFDAQGEFPAAALLQLLLEYKDAKADAQLLQLQIACAEKKYRSAAELYWGARALSACERKFPGQTVAWRSHFVAALLAGQQGDGALLLTGQKKTRAENMLETALLLQVLQLADMAK
ncbi:MAG: hypothetical protein GX946_01465 [Oligosphaeraceae bacterium]|nr:hypothetical protein [Oligosphaeraceae bacterium]